MLRLFLDASVLFTAAHRPEGKAAFLFLPELSQRWTLVGNRYVLDEAERNLRRKYPACVARLGHLRSALTLVEPGSGPERPVLSLPSKDMPVWLAAVEARCSHLLTGDLRDFGPFMNQPERCAGITIQTVAEFLARVADDHTIA